MKKLRALAIYALVTPALALGAGSLLAQSTDQDMDREQQSTQHDQDAAQSYPRTTQSDQHTQSGGLSDSKTAADRQKKHDKDKDKYGKKNRGYMDSAPANGMQASALIGAEVKTTGDENVGPVDDLIIDEDGQVVAIVVGVGGFLGIGEKDVAIGWDDVTRSKGTSDDKEHDLRVDLTRDDLRSAPKFATRD